MKSILVVDDLAIFREPITASLCLAGYSAVGAADGEEALRLTRANRPDLIVLDVAMPGMDGIAFLKRLRSEPAIAGTHVILLSDVSDKFRILAAGSLGVKDYVLKTRFHLDDLLERIKRFDAQTTSSLPIGQPHSSRHGESSKSPTADTAPTRGTVEVPRLLSRNQVLERVENVFQAKTLSGVVAEVIAMASSPRGDTPQLAALISRDPMLSARVLQAANSALYATSGAVVTTIPDAIRKVGYKVVRNIGAALSIFECMPDAGMDGFDPIRCWQHSFAVAQLCERLSTGKAADHSGLAYIVGICHDLGDIFIHTQFGKECQQVNETAARTGRPRDQLYSQMLGMTPAQMISAILKSISLPDAIREPIEMLHAPKPWQSKSPLVQILWMAENCANAAMLASSPASEVAPLTQAFCLDATGNPNPAWPDPQSLRSEVLATTVALARLSRADESILVAPMFKPQIAKLWIARDPRVSEFDPVGLACKSLVQVVVNNRLPTERETDEVGGLLVIASSDSISGFSGQDIEAALKRVRKSGRNFPVSAVACGESRVSQPENEIPWHASMSISELAEFSQSMDKTSQRKAVA